MNPGEGLSSGAAKYRTHDHEFTAESIAASVQAAIRSDVEAGQVPITVAGFGDLHSYVDANEYLVSVVPQEVYDEEATSDWPRFNAAIEMVDAWIVNGGLKRG